ncbi:Integrase, catalytic core protein [Phytophthora megakarya]|uniref:Integrase, catalytic core protein n=1 Tax=Phytophthora megakarya TaxID=4795 RepID=A0A225UKL3_9STRA|nr:Integrase, catalytic core protein [Phytophthora megakarya]
MSLSRFAWCILYEGCFSVRGVFHRRCLYGNAPNEKELPVWGSVSFAHVPVVLRKDKKLSARAVKCRFLGISDETKGYR